MASCLRTAYALRGTETSSEKIMIFPKKSLRTAYALRGTETMRPSTTCDALLCLRTAYALRGTETISKKVLLTPPVSSEDCLRPTGH